MKKALQLLLFITAIGFYGNLNASHIMGSDMTYKSLGNKKYEITLTIYRDCRGISLGTSASINIEANGNSNNVTLFVDTVLDVNPQCGIASSPCTPVNTTNGQGVEAHVYRGTMDLGLSPYSTWITNGACKFYFSWTSCCRNGAITTGVSGGFYTYSMLDVCNAVDNTSPTFTSAPVARGCCNQAMKLSLGGQDYKDFDSLSYKLVAPLGNHRTDYLYPSSPLDTEHPMTNYCLFGSSIPCTAVPSYDPPLGVYFDKKTGYFVFTPTKCDEVGVVAFEITEWRKISGVYKIVGTTRRDIQIEIENCGNNNVPTLTSSVGTTVNINKSHCEDLCFQISSKDIAVIPPPPLPSQKPDTTFLSVTNLPPGATFTIIDSNARERVGQFCWKIPKGIPKDFRTQVVFNVKDNFCPLSATSQLIVSINLDSTKNNSRLEGIVKYDSNSDCSIDTLDTGVSREVQVAVKGRSQKITTQPDGSYGFCLEADTGFMRLVASPFYDDQCRTDSTLRFKASLIHKINFATRLKNGLYGNIMDDLNENCQLDANEWVYYAPVTIVAQPGNIVSSTDRYGRYFLQLDSHVNYTIYIRDSLRYNFTCKSSYTFNYAKDSAYFAKDLFIKGLKLDNVDATYRGLSSARLAVTSTAKFYAINADTGKYDKTYATLLLDSNLSNITVTANTGSVTKVNNGEYKITFDSLNTYSYYDSVYGWLRPHYNKFRNAKQYVTVKYQANLPNYNIDSSLVFQFWIDSLDYNKSIVRKNDTVQKRIFVRAAYDPNIKTTFQKKYITPVDTRIDYHIQFQNTGNDTAINIEVRDTLPPYLNYATFQFNQSTHPVRPLICGNKLFLYFDNIYLPDSGKNLEASIGSFDFSIDAYDTMKANKDLFNSASIYFDVQEPVKTNTSHIIYHSPTVVNALDKQIFCYGEKIKVPFTGVYDPKYPNHKYYLQMSSVTDNFANPIVLDSIQTNAQIDTFNMVLPKTTVSGQYKFRVTGSPDKAIPFEPFYSKQFEYKAKDWASIYTKQIAPYCEGQTLKFIADTGYSNYTFVRNLTTLKNNLTDSVYSITLAANDKSIYAKLNYKNTCDIISDTLAISVKLIDSAKFILKDSFLCSLPHAFEITNNSKGFVGTKYYLNANGKAVDSANSLVQKLNFNPSAAGKYDLRLLSKTVDGCVDSTASKKVTAGITPITGFTVLNSPICGNQPIQINSTATANGNGIDSSIYIWGDGARDEKTSHVYVNMGTYNIQQVVKDSVGCADTTQGNAALNPSPKAIFNFTLDSCLQSNKITINTSSTFIGSLKLSETIDFGDNNTSTSASTSNNYAAAGNYLVQIIAVNQDNCADTAIANITIHPNPVFSLNITAIDSCFRNNYVDIEALGTNVNTVDWDMGDGSSLNGTTANKNYAVEGPYTITGKATSSFGCEANQSLNINILPDMEVDMAVNDACEQENITFEISTIYNKVNNFSYALDFNGSSILGNYPTNVSQTVSNVQSGIYQSQLIAQAANGCKDTVNINHQVYAKPNADFVLDVVGSKVNFINLNTQAQNKWFYGNNDSAINNSANHSYTYTSNGDYTVVLKVTDNNNCFDTAQQQVHIVGGITFFVPSAFTPNNDGKNDQLTISGTEFISNLNFKLFNRWGQQVYESTDPNGLLAQTYLADGSYLYVMYIQDIKGFKHNISGTLMILK